MKPILVLLLLWPAASVFSQAPADKIMGTWVSENNDSRIQISRSGNQYMGKLLWGNQVVESDGKTFKKDVNNPDAAQRSRSLQGITLISGLTYREGRWADGRIYDPPSGRTYNCRIELKGDKLHMRGYMGVPMLGQTVVWNRVND